MAEGGGRTREASMPIAYYLSSLIRDPRTDKLSLPMAITIPMSCVLHCTRPPFSYLRSASERHMPLYALASREARSPIRDPTPLRCPCDPRAMGTPLLTRSIASTPPRPTPSRSHTRLTISPMPDARCPMPDARCPMPDAQRPAPT